MLLTVVAADAGGAREALGAMAAALPSPLTLFNEPEGGPVAEALRGLGFARYDRQHELVLEPGRPGMRQDIPRKVSNPAGIRQIP